MRSKVLIVFAMMAWYSAFDSWATVITPEMLHMGGPSGWLTTDSGDRIRFVSLGDTTKPHVLMIDGHNANEVESMTWKDCCNVSVVFRDGTSEVTNTVQIRDAEIEDGIAITSTFGVDGLPVTVPSPKAQVLKVIRFSNFKGIKSIQFDRQGSKQWLEAASLYGDTNKQSHQVNQTNDATADRLVNVATPTHTLSQVIVSDGATEQCGSLREFTTESGFYPLFSVSQSYKPKQIDVYSCANGDDSCANPGLYEEGNFDKLGRLTFYKSSVLGEVTFSYEGTSTTPIEKSSKDSFGGTTVTKYILGKNGLAVGYWNTYKDRDPKAKPITKYLSGKSISKQGDVTIITSTIDDLPGTQSKQRITRIYSDGLLRSSTLPEMVFGANPGTVIKTYQCKYETAQNGSHSTTEFVKTDDGRLLPDAKTVFDASGRPVLDSIIIGNPENANSFIKNTKYYYSATDVRGNWTRRKKCDNRGCETEIRKISYWQ